MKPKINASLSYKEGNFIIRCMCTHDVTSYADKMSDTPSQREALKKQMLEILKQIEEDEEGCNYYFTVLYDGLFYGAINTTSRNIIGTKGNVFFYLPTSPEFAEMNKTAVKAFISLCKENHIYDEELHIMFSENGSNQKFVINMESSQD